MRRWIAAALLCVLCFGIAFAEHGRTNIVIFLVDDMGLMDTSVPMLTDAEGKPQRHPLNDWYRTPNMERLAAKGVRFSNFYSHNVCSPTRISIMTGRNSARHRCTDYINPYVNNRQIDNKRYPLAVCQQVPPEWNWRGLGEGDLTLPGLLKQAGYTTIHVGKAHFAPDQHEGADPRVLGFDVNVGGSAIGHPQTYYGEGNYGKGSKQAVPHLEKYHGTDTFLTEALTLEAMAEVDKALAAEKPFFLYMSHYAVHAPFNSDPRFAAHYRAGAKPEAARAYATLIEGMDKSLGDLMDHLEAKGVAKDTLIIFLGDNGGDAPLAGLDDISSSAPLRGRKGGKWEGGMRVPFIAAWGKPDTNTPWQKKLPIPAGSIRRGVGTCCDLFPTIANLVEAPVDAGHPVDGQDLGLLLSGQPDPERRHEFLNHYPHPRRGQSHFFTTWRMGDWKVTYQYLAEGGDRYALYDLSKDPSESQNLAASHPGKLRSMMQGMVLRLQAMDAVYPVKDGRALEPVIPSPKEPDEKNTRMAVAAKPSAAGPAAPLFTEDFNAEISVKGRHRQAQTNLPIKHGYDAMPGWTRLGRKMPAHFVERSPGDWALMLVARQANENVFTLNGGFAANEEGRTYSVAFDAAPAVYQGLSQATTAKDELMLDLLRSDGTVLKKHRVRPGKWDGTSSFTSQIFAYTGDGSGPLRFRISPVFTTGTRFYGAIDNLQVFGSMAEAEAAARKRAKREQRIRERRLTESRRLDRLEQLPALERDWLFQADDKPTFERALQEITWARELAARLGGESEAPSFSAELKNLAALEKKLNEPGAVRDDWQLAEKLYIAVRQVKRRIAMGNPVIDFNRLLFIDQPYPSKGGKEWRHEAIHRLGHRAVPGGRLLVLDGLHPNAAARQLHPSTPGSFWRPDLSFDGSKVLFCFKPEDGKSFHLYEIKLDGSGLRQLTGSDYDDIDPIYLPDGHILFTTTRGNTYVRCGPYIYSNVLARCDPDGGNVYLISRNSEPDFVPALLDDGRIVYSRWEYSDKDQNRVQSLWTTNQDGTGTAVLWGNQSIWPDHLAEPRPIPGSPRVMFTGVGHHNWFNGSIGIIDPNEGFNYPKGLTRVTWDLPWGEVGAGPGDRPESPDYHASGRFKGYLGPYPLSAEDFLVSALGRDNKYRIYLMDVHGNRELIYEGEHNAWYPIPVRPRPIPHAHPDTVAWPGTGENRGPVKPGVFYNADVYQGVPELQRGRVKYLRVFQQDAKTYSTWHKTFVFSGPAVSAVQTEAVKRIVSEVPVERDGSVSFEAPAGKALFFQLLDGQYRALHTMRSFTGVMPGERRGCVGCHAMHSTAPPPSPALAQQRPPTPVSPPPWGDESIGYERFVQPVLDRYCGECHQGDSDARDDPDLTLRPATGIFRDHFKEPYLTLIGPAAWPKPVPGEDQPGYGLAGAFPVYGLQSQETYPHDPGTDDRSAIWRTMRPEQYLSFKSPLIDMASSGEHYDTMVDPLSLRRLIAWVDANCPFNGEEEIRAMDDPGFAGIEELPIRPRLKTAPEIERP